jgi:hypothetical protein
VVLLSIVARPDEYPFGRASHTCAVEALCSTSTHPAT